ncbi:glycosylphosphatidylinositol anchor biosynthesis [Rhodotorula sphaerocarpa]
MIASAAESSLRYEETRRTLCTVRRHAGLDGRETVDGGGGNEGGAVRGRKQQPDQDSAEPRRGVDLVERDAGSDTDDPDMQDPAARPPYRKVLFLRQPYPDNHVDSSFLADLKRNVNVHPANLPALLRQTLPITQHVASIFLFVAVFVRLARGDLSATGLLGVCAGLAGGLRVWAGVVAGAAAAEEGDDSAGEEDDGDGDGLRPTAPAAASPTPLSLTGTAIPLVALYLLAPVLKTLTRATTSDSIGALSGALFAVNVLLADYRAVPPVETGARSGGDVAWWRRGLGALFRRSRGARSSRRHRRPPGRSTPPPLARRRAPLPSTLSLTAALSGSTVLASRLALNAQVFALLLFSTLWFGPFPLLRSTLSLRPTLVMTYGLCAASLLMVQRAAAGGAGTATVTATWAAGAVLVGISVGAPMARGWLHVRYKDRLSGPWDVVPPRGGGS